MRMVFEWENPGMETRKCRIRQKRNEVLVFIDNACILSHFLRDHVTHQTGMVIIEVIPCDIEAPLNLSGNDGRRNELRMGMNDRRPCFFAIILEQNDVLDARIALMCAITLAISFNDRRDVFKTQIGDTPIMVWRIDNDLVNAKAINARPEKIAAHGWL